MIPKIRRGLRQTMVLIEVEIPHIRTELPVEDNDLEQLAGHENDAGGQQSGQELSHHQHVAANRREKVKMETLVEDFAAEQIHEDSQATEEDREPQIEKLEYSGENDGILAQVVAFPEMNAADFSIREIDIQIVDSVGIVVVLVSESLRDFAGLESAFVRSNENVSAAFPAERLPPALVMPGLIASRSW